MFNKFLVAVVIILIIVFIGVLITNVDEPELEKETSDGVVSLVKNWIIETPTFKERGGSDLQHVRTVDIGENIYEVTFTFNSIFAGYGPVGKEEVTAQVITPHTIVVVVEGGKVVSAITDNYFDEINQKEKINFNATESFVYFIEFEEEKLVPLKREVDGNDVKKETLLLLLEGPTEKEKASGYSTAINEKVKINSFEVKNQTAYVDFSKEIEVSGGSALVLTIRQQIEKTLLQFEEIESVVISVEGETEEILQP